jgi:hypothetical protein
MNAAMAGMTPVMVVLMSHDMQVMEFTSIRLWGSCHSPLWSGP